MGKIVIENIRAEAFHGVFAEEREKGNTFSVDLYMYANIEAAARSDALEDTIDYSIAYQITMDILSKPVNLLETLAVDIAKQVMGKLPQLDRIKVRVSKDRPLYMEHCDRTYVEYETAKKNV
ncbi:dihydroneopterin aldolase [Pontibacter sp. G13]|uniref:dihydroneopterin aldolase n=1 Tax=Pontibacter sp. G13 TaxID=3074898 RepID=UPI00288A1FB9|nr:dihydroneopterin aldolase [Pontibacter sp. G13]WNJ20851.1 dihydroneopterin aldolase [Pontibacter sp. G13]